LNANRRKETTVIEMPRDLARRFRAVLRGSLLAEGPRASWPLLVVRAGPEGLTLQARQADSALLYSQPGAAGEGAIAFRSDLLAQVEGRRADPVVLEQVTFGKGRACWTDAGVSRTVEFETVTTDSVSAFPALPKQFTPMPAGLLTALAEAARTTPRDNSRYALTRIQIRGKAGQMAATDGKQLLVQSGFTFPWAEDVLVPRVPAVGSRELAGEETVQVGRTASHVAVRAGGWTFLLPIDASSRYPDVNQVIPRPGPQATYLRFHPEDASFLLDNLPRLPGRDDQYAPVTLDLDQPACVRARDDAGGRVTEVVLSRSSVTGPPVRLCINRCYLGRALKLGFVELVALSPDKPLVCRDPNRTYVFMPLSDQAALAPGKGMLHVASADSPTPTPATPPERRRDPMTPVPPNGQGHDSDRPRQSQPESPGIEEIITEAEAVRAQLQEASGRMARLLAALKHQRRQSRAVQAAMASLRQLQLGR
jgi:hypothetical protein